MTGTVENLRTDTIEGFLEALAAKVPAPGGGATAALHLGQAAALVSMVARYTSGPRYAEHEAAGDRGLRAVRSTTGQGNPAHRRRHGSFRGVIASYKLPKSTPAEAQARSAAIAAAATAAAAVPAEVAGAAAEVVDLAEQLSAMWRIPT